MAQNWAFINSGEYNALSGTSFDLSAFAAIGGNAVLLSLYTATTTDYVSPSSVTDTAGNIYNFIASYDYFLLSTYRTRLHIYAAYDITGNTNNVVHISLPSSSGMRAIACQFSGLLTTGTQDSGYAPIGNFDNTSPIATQSASTSENDELIFGMFEAFDNNTLSSNSPSIIQQQTAEDYSPMAVATFHASSAGSNNVSILESGTISYGTICLARAFKQVPAGTTEEGEITVIGVSLVDDTGSGARSTATQSSAVSEAATAGSAQRSGAVLVSAASDAANAGTAQRSGSIEVSTSSEATAGAGGDRAAACSVQSISQASISGQSVRSGAINISALAAVDARGTFATLGVIVDLSVESMTALRTLHSMTARRTIYPI